MQYYPIRHSFQLDTIPKPVRTHFYGQRPHRKVVRSMHSQNPETNPLTLVPLTKIINALACKVDLVKGGAVGKTQIVSHPFRAL